MHFLHKSQCGLYPGDGLIQQSELQQVLQACMEENGMKFSSEQIEDLTLAMFEDADTENQGEITYEALKAQLEKHNGLLENLSIRCNEAGNIKLFKVYNIICSSVLIS